MFVSSLSLRDGPKRAVEAMEAAAEAKNYDRLFFLDDDFVDLYPQEPYGHAFLALALAERAEHDKGLAATNRAVELGMDESEAHLLRAHIYERRGSIGKVIQEFSALILIAQTRSYGLLKSCVGSCGDWRSRSSSG